MLLRQFSKYFSSNSRAQGEYYFDEGLVSNMQETEMSLTAVVSGSTDYAVRYSWDGKSVNIKSSCTCPHFEGGHFCKHLWAVLYACDINRNIPAFFTVSRNFRLMHAEVEIHNASPTAQPKNKPDRQRYVSWKHQIDRIQQDSTSTDIPYWRTDTSQNPLEDGSEIWYELYLSDKFVKKPVIRFRKRSGGKQGALGKLKVLTLNDEQISQLPEEEQELLSLLIGNRPEIEHSSYSIVDSEYSGCTISSLKQDLTLEKLCKTGRFGYSFNLSRVPSEVTLLKWDLEPPSEFELSFEEVKEEGWKIHGSLMRGKEELHIAAPTAYIESGFFIIESKLSKLANPDILPWIRQLKRGEGLFIHKSEAEEFAVRITKMRAFPKLNAGSTFPWKFVTGDPTPKISFSAKRKAMDVKSILGKLSFSYGNETEKKNKKKGILYSPNKAAEKQARNRLAQLGVRPSKEYPRDENDFEVNTKNFVPVVQQLLKLGWKVESERLPVRTFGEIKIEVSSGVDWFDLKLKEKDRDAISILPEILEAIKNGDTFIELGDGTKAILPEEWLKNFGTIAKLGLLEDDNLRFKSSQAYLLGQLLEAQDSTVTKDVAFNKLMNSLAANQQILPKKEPAGFKGKLRAYQKKGLGWLKYLEDIELNGCLADDMGLGKTIQVLALLQSTKSKLPSLIVAPKSLVFNWISESRKFTPNLKIVEYTGGNRKQTVALFANSDLVVTTYGAVRSDILELSKLKFHYVVLDESQSIKNSSSQIAKAVRLLQSKHRLILSGTPIENHLGELWSQFEFLNPGMLGSEASFRGLSQNADSTALAPVSRALEPFILRRTKEQVLKELPPKTEQVIFCDFEEHEKKVYEELRDFYRSNLKDRIGEFGINRSQIQILEALLRMRQASCDFRLLDKHKKAEPGAKIRVLLQRLEEILQSGHKALVFSQFTSFLSLVKTALDNSNITYEYLDGKTKDRKERVQRFQEDKDCSLFLLSLKAGGVGLNLTAADYVFVLDPWWNPAVEAQAIDRAHRIGQKNPVMVYRLIVQGTIEEKVLALQKKKKELTQSILSGDKSSIRAITQEDLQLLFE